MGVSLPRSEQRNKQATVNILRRNLLCHEPSGQRIFQASCGDILKCNNCLNSVKICGDTLAPFGYFTPLTSCGRRMTLRHNVLRDSVSDKCCHVNDIRDSDQSNNHYDASVRDYASKMQVELRRTRSTWNDAKPRMCEKEQHAPQLRASTHPAGL